MEDNFSDCQKQLAQVNHNFEEFVYIVSHDLKAPIRAISNLSDWIQEDLSSEAGEEVQSNLKLLKSRTERLERMLGAILEISQIPRHDIDITESNLTDLLKETIQPFINNEVQITLPTNLPTITTYSKKLQQVLEQLIKNAINYSDKEKVVINIAAEDGPDFIKLAVSDNGPGISPPIQDKIFTMFYTGRSKDLDEAIGAGLTIAKKTAEFAGGSLELKRPVNASTFLINWPKNLNLNN